jgi:uncharacterized protein YhaN
MKTKHYRIPWSDYERIKAELEAELAALEAAVRATKYTIEELITEENDMKEFKFNPDQPGTKEWQWLHHKLRMLELSMGAIDGSLNINACILDMEAGTPCEGSLRAERKRLEAKMRDVRREMQATKDRISELTGETQSAPKTRKD